MSSECFETKERSKQKLVQGTRIQSNWPYNDEIVTESWMLFSKSTANIGQLQSPGEWRPRDMDTRCQCQVSGRAGPVSGAPGMLRVEEGVYINNNIPGTGWGRSFTDRQGLSRLEYVWWPHVITDDTRTSRMIRPGKLQICPYQHKTLRHVGPSGASPGRAGSGGDLQETGRALTALAAL